MYATTIAPNTFNHYLLAFIYIIKHVLDLRLEIV
jgi:hypothetical protein